MEGKPLILGFGNFNLGFGDKDGKKENLEVYTFGTPPIGDENFCSYYEEKLYLHRFVNENDVVARLDMLIRFKHIGEAILLPSNQGEGHSGLGYIDNIIDRMEL